VEEKERAMTRAEKLLYNQIHPLKLFTDFSTSAISSYFLWQHLLVPALLVGFLPSIAITLALVLFADLEPYKASRFGHSVGMHMTRAITLQRITGQLIMWLAAYQHAPALIALGLCVVLLAWASVLTHRAR
jgi:hypothetical protein